MYDYFYGTESEQFFFYRIPKVLFTDERFKTTSTEANNINQIAKRLNESGRIYDADIAEIQERQKQLWEIANGILTKLSKVG